MMIKSLMIKTLILAAALLLCLGSGQLAMADNVQTLGEFTGPGPIDDPGPFPTLTVGTFSILPGDTSITISGTFGNSTVASTAGVNLYLGSILVAQCTEFEDPCWTGSSGTPTPWTYSLTTGQIGSLTPGTIDFTAVMTSEFIVQLGVTTLDQVTPPSAVPEPTTLLMLGSGILSLLGLARRKSIL